jgi:hypothetical protein
VAFLRSVVAQTVTVVDSNSLYRRMAGLVETCADFPLGTTDTAVAERLGITEIATSGGWAARCCGSGMPGPARR